MRPPKKHIHNQKHCYWFSKWYFPHWILADLQLRLSKLWGIICSTTVTKYFWMFQAAVPFSHPYLLWPHIIMGNCSLLSLTPSSLLQNVTLELLCHLSLHTISFPESRLLCPANPGYILSQQVQIIFFSNTDVLCCFIFSAPGWEISKYSHSWFFFPVPNFCSSLVITKMQPCVCGYHTAWCCSRLLCPLPTILFIICLEAKPINSLE